MWWAAAATNSAALIAAPDIELLTLTEMVDAVWRIADAVDLPVFADGDNGHGNTTNVPRTVKQFEKAGAAINHVGGSGFAQALRPHVEQACRADG